MTERQYAAAGVDLRAADEAKARIAALVEGTKTSLAAGKTGGFGGMVALPPGMRRPLLVMSTDGVGTKVLVARGCDRLDTVGEDLVNHCVNDILVHGARPLAFQDYLAIADLTVEETAAIVEGVARGCRAHGMVLAGGETAQMPELYQPGHFDLAGTIVGVVEEEDALHGDRIIPGDALVGLASLGLHTNGYTLARRVLLDRLGLTLDSVVEELGVTVGEALLAPHRSYERALRSALRGLHGLAHVTGGGIPGNLVRVLPEGCRAIVQTGTWPRPPLFSMLQRGGAIPEEEMLEVFNVGIGMIAVLPEEEVEGLREHADAAGVDSWRIGAIVSGERGVHLE